MKSPPNESFTAFVGIDWADKKHDVCVQPAGSEMREFSVIPHKVEMINDWAQSLIQRFGSPIAVTVELSKGPIVYALQKFDCFVIYPINPLSLARYRETFTPSRAKDDPTDVEFAVDILLRHPDRFKPLKPQSMEMRALSSLVEQRRSLVNDKIRITNRLRSAFKHYYPQVLDWFDHIDTPLFCDFIRHWPTLTQVKRARKNTLETFFNQHNMRFAQLLADRLEAIKTATPLTSDDAIIIPYRLQALVLIEQLSVTLEGIKQFDQEIENIARKHSDYPLFSALPGAGPSLAPRLLVAFGVSKENDTRRGRFTKIRWRCSSDRAQRQKALGSLALAVSDFHTTDVYRMGSTDDQQILLGRPILSAAARKRLHLSSSRASFGV